jgi:hypothetical protein
MAAIFPGLEFAGLLYIQLFQAKVQATGQSNLTALFTSIAAESDQLAAVNICKTCRSFHRRHSAAIKKN